MQMKKWTQGIAAVGVAAALGVGCASGPLTTREKSAAVGGLGGAAAGALIGGGLGLGAGALIGDQMQAQENRNYQQDQEIRRQQYEIDRLRRERSEY